MKCLKKDNEFFPRDRFSLIVLENIDRDVVVSGESNAIKNISECLQEDGIGVIITALRFYRNCTYLERFAENGFKYGFYNPETEILLVSKYPQEIDIEKYDPYLKNLLTKKGILNEPFENKMSLQPIEQVCESIINCVLETAEYFNTYMGRGAKRPKY